MWQDLYFYLKSSLIWCNYAVVLSNCKTPLFFCWYQQNIIPHGPNVKFFLWTENCLHLAEGSGYCFSGSDAGKREGAGLSERNRWNVSLCRIQNNNNRTRSYCGYCSTPEIHWTQLPIRSKSIWYVWFDSSILPDSLLLTSSSTDEPFDLIPVACSTRPCEQLFLRTR